MSNNIERRFSNSSVSLEKSEGREPVIYCRALEFETRAKFVDFFEETIKRGALDDAIKDDVVALYNHNHDKVLSSLRNGTLDMKISDVGVDFRSGIPDTSYGKDVRALMDSGEVASASFGMFPDLDEIEIDRRGSIPLRIIHKIKELDDVTVCARGRYDSAQSELRASKMMNLDEILEQMRPEMRDAQRSISMMDMDLFFINRDAPKY